MLFLPAVGHALLPAVGFALLPAVGPALSFIIAPDLRVLLAVLVPLFALLHSSRHLLVGCGPVSDAHHWLLAVVPSVLLLQSDFVIVYDSVVRVGLLPTPPLSIAPPLGRPASLGGLWSSCFSD